MRVFCLGRFDNKKRFSKASFVASSRVGGRKHCCASDDCSARSSLAVRWSGGGGGGSGGTSVGALPSRVMMAHTYGAVLTVAWPI